ncbi:tetratricopeptide repeat-containing glycosyltransferase [Streptomyces abyssomicinicus]|uniref:tetratricopeptide repeat-containing glycosyltransferase n=1 Tax=Streptomyces abyssomicinicus TaxID=574929 RepID=UPI001FE93490|nr:glycosyltransferase [Streptomyces abyssomicinicus]
MTRPNQGQRPTICLCMIVKNESGVIERCLEAVRPLIDTWIIDDTGSTDGTQELVRKVLDDIPGELHEEPWVDFGHNRTANLRRARGQADYLLLLDADMVLRREAPLPELTADAYMLRHAGPLEYRVKRLVRADMPWRYEGSTHEYLTVDADHTTVDLDALVVDHRADGGSRSDKFTRDAVLLRRELGRDPDSSRAVFYLAQTLRDLGEREEAIALYERRAAMGGWEEEVYYALLQAGVLRAAAGDEEWPRAMETLVRAWQARPERLEACYELAARLRKRGHYQAAHAFAAAGVNRAAPADWLFVQPWVYSWGLLFEFSITSYWVGDTRASQQASERLLALPDLPDDYRRHAEANRALAAKRGR